MSTILTKQTPVAHTHAHFPKKKWQNSFVLWVMTGVLFVFPLIGKTNELLLNDFSDVSHLTLNGDAKTLKTQEGVILRLTAAKRLQSSSVFSTVKVNTTNFSTYFKFKITEPGGVLSGGDGFAFVVQSVSSNVGSQGGGLGYEGIPKSIGVEFDTWDNKKEKDSRNDHDANHIGINIGGLFNGPTQSVSPAFENGEIWHAWIDYDGNQVSVRVNTTGKKPAKPLLTREVNLLKLLGGSSQAFIGFTSATGGAYANHDILSWMYMDKLTEPEPNVDVWMADSKRDKGVEPNKLSRRFWLSPDIWTRNQEDGITKYQNVELGQDNFVYVNVRNQGTAVAKNTTVEVYRSIPSLGNRWPKGWDFVGKGHIDSIEPNAHQNVAIRWNKEDIPKPGHYCFYVRLVNENDPMTSKEISDSLVNTRKNNNIAWRNFNVVNLLKDVTKSFDIKVYNIKEKDVEVDITLGEKSPPLDKTDEPDTPEKYSPDEDKTVVEKEQPSPDEEENEESFLDNEGTNIFVELDCPLFKSWQASGAKGINLKTLDDGTKIQLLKTPAKLLGIPVKSGESHDIRVQLAAYEPTFQKGVSGEYHLSTQQWIDGELAGGMDYAISTRALDTDTDGDGIKDINDPDDDNDGKTDSWEVKNGFNPLDSNNQIVKVKAPLCEEVTEDEPEPEPEPESEKPCKMPPPVESPTCPKTISTPEPKIGEGTIRCEMAPDVAPPTTGLKETTGRFRLIPGSKEGTILFEMIPSTEPICEKVRYADNGDGTVTDNETGLIWLKNANCIGTRYSSFDRDCSSGEGKVNWQDAQAFIEGLNRGQFPECSGKYRDWRLPSVQELQSLVNYRFSNPAMSNAAGTGPWQENDAFFSLKTDNYWTSTLDASNPDFAWRVRFDRGLLFTEQKSYPFYVWPVRGKRQTCPCPIDKVTPKN